MSKIGILGTGTWGVALARVLSLNQHEVIAWSAIEDEIRIYQSTHQHKNLPNMIIPDSIQFTTDMEKAVKNQEFLIVSTPSIYVRSTIEKAKPYLSSDQIIISVAKGIEEETLMNMTEIIHDVVGKNQPVVALSGPTHAEEVALDLPTTIVAACSDHDIAQEVQNLFDDTCMRVYTSTDVKGAELCGAFKNIIALCCGISTGLGFGDNTKAALITRGILEIKRLGVIMNCDSSTFDGLAGIGDLIVTATSTHSRNNMCGYYIGQGYSVNEAKEKVGMVVEGINALPAAKKLIDKYQIEMPITELAYQIIFKGIKAKEAVIKLMSRDKKKEFY